MALVLRNPCPDEVREILRWPEAEITKVNARGRQKNGTKLSMSPTKLRIK
jgi:hypothetical protein